MTSSPRPALPRWLGFVIGAALIAAAAVAIGSHAEEFSRAIAAARGAPWWLLALSLLLPAVNWQLMALSFWILLRRHGNLRFTEMCWLIGVAWLLNYLPMRPGLVGRVAYHKTVNQIPVATSIAATMLSIACAGVATGILVGTSAASAAVGAGPQAQIILVCVVPTLILLVLTIAFRTMGGSWWIAGTVSLRYIDLLVWTARYLVVFAIIGYPVSLIAAAAIAAVGQAAMLIPLSGNGLGLREWAVGAVSSWLPPGILSSTGRLTTAVGLIADLINRVAELACAVPIGLLSAAALARKPSKIPPNADLH